MGWYEGERWSNFVCIVFIYKVNNKVNGVIDVKGRDGATLFVLYLYIQRK
jgi:hypothetical protein